tara:strand:+ start:1189 stop:1764 length:576 start_codon:yes stop_codon:yes gene_type:complete
MAQSDLSIFDGEARYAGRTRVNRLVYDFAVADLNGATTVSSSSFSLNGEVHQIILDISASKLGANANANTVTGTFALESAIPTVSGAVITPFAPITSLDYTNKTPGRYYQFQTNEGAAMGTQEHALTVPPGLSGHDTPAAPKTPITNGTQTVINKNQPWTGRMCGNWTIKLTSGTAWAADTGVIRVIIIYS